MGFKTTAGAKLFIGDSSSPTSWTEVGEMEDFGEFGRTYEQGTRTPVGTRGTQKYKTSFDDGNPTYQLAYDPDGQGQSDLETALDDDADYPFKIELNDAPSGSGTTPTTWEFRARVMSFTKALGTVQDYVRGNVTLGITPDTKSFTPAS